jgi:hypothetical protein
MLRQIIRHYLPLALIITAFCALAYLLSQQMLRLGANEPQVQWAQDTAARLSAGEALASVVPAGTLDVGRSLAPFTIVYDDSGKVLVATGQLHGQPPALPSGVLNYVRQNGEDRISWQPEPGVRYAAVVERVTGAQPGFVLVARSLREAEDRIGVMGQLAVAAWLATQLASLVLVVLVEWVLGVRGK